MWNSITDYFYPEDLQRAKFTEEKEQKEDPNELIKIIMGNSYLRRQLCSFYSWKFITIDKIKNLDKSFKYWCAFIRISKLYNEEVPEINYTTTIEHYDFWYEWYKENS